MDRAITFGCQDATGAAANSYSEVVRWLYTRTVGVNRRDGDAIAAAVNAGGKQGLGIRAEEGLSTTPANGHLEMVQWILERNDGVDEADKVMVKAAEQGHLEIVRLAIEMDWHGKILRSLNEQVLIGTGAQFTHAIHAAASNGHLQVDKDVKSVLTKIRTEIQDDQVSGATVQQAANRGFLHVVQ
ncbi:hypothetical protein BBJ29_006176 [Phytophthora kernoviae]|uniref:Uncharacterized protein n=1 Tax=Phytophthora kernoviae TaxID=325452 RepID=A0A3F2RSY1_9STRA|nr:hypothetical protein BBP00_00003962 [Phytophthora kernoviae]RLN65730.1 hypothetical protein BBJ29_006176 [Phytophthora kernoviae]